jgi:hypothetical protein
MRWGIALSSLLHLAVLTIFHDTWLWRELPAPEVPIAVELIVETPPPEPPPPMEMSETLDPGLMRDPRAEPPPAPAVVDQSVDLPALEAAPMPAMPQPSEIQQQAQTARAEPPPEPPPPLEMSDSLDPALQRDPRAEPPPAPAVIDQPLDLPPREAVSMPAMTEPSDIQSQAQTARAEAPPPPAPKRALLSVPEPRRKPAWNETALSSRRVTDPLEPRGGPPAQPQIARQDPAAPRQVPPGEVSPAQLLANLEALQDEDLQARKNPELWAIIRALRAQVARCWGKDKLSPGQMGLTVDIRVAFETGGRLGQALIVEVSRMVHDESYRDFAATARKMLRQCSPYDLPAESYHLWRSFTVRFVARGR